MSTPTGAILAAIDLGSNSAKITVAAAHGPAPQMDGAIDILAHESTMLRLGESVNMTGKITPEKQDAVITTLQQYQQLAQKYEASSITVVATEAVRKAQNREAFLNAIQQETGLAVHTVNGSTEATLTFLGAISDHQEVSNASLVDIGGGSTELIIAQQGHIQWLTSLPIGSGWLHDHYLPSDPPTTVETDQARTFLHTYLHHLQLPQEPSAEQAPRRLIATGSSAKILLALARQALQVDKETHTLSRYDLNGCFGLLSALPASEIARRYEQSLERACVLPSGALILLALMDYLRLEEISVSQRGVSEGTLLAVLRYGDSWLEHPDLKVDATRIGKAPAISDKDTGGNPAPASQQQSETFAQTGQRELRKRSQTFVKSIAPVLANKDIEDVHKMRVASRRLRAALDGYESACAQKPFKQVYQETKQTADVLGTARDTDVMLQNLEQQRQQMPDDEKPGLQWLIYRLQNYRDQQQRAIEVHFKDFNSRRFQRLAASCIPNGGSSRGKS